MDTERDTGSGGKPQFPGVTQFQGGQPHILFQQTPSGNVIPIDPVGSDLFQHRESGGFQFREFCPTSHRGHVSGTQPRRDLVGLIDQAAHCPRSKLEGVFVMAIKAVTRRICVPRLPALRILGYGRASHNHLFPGLYVMW
ncbi:MAG: hypothetical protein O2821_13940 [Chloroflexi bacterium]|nr:hypothetical protein [Chloroflexota bacterium]